MKKLYSTLIAAVALGAYSLLTTDLAWAAADPITERLQQLNRTRAQQQLNQLQGEQRLNQLQQDQRLNQVQQQLNQIQ